jgi:hypothetical protein
MSSKGKQARFRCSCSQCSPNSFSSIDVENAFMRLRQNLSLLAQYSRARGVDSNHEVSQTGLDPDAFLAIDEMVEAALKDVALLKADWERNLARRPAVVAGGAR